MRRSLIEDKKNFNISPGVKNYQSNKELKFYKTVPAYSQDEGKSCINNSSLETLRRDGHIKQWNERSGSVENNENFIDYDSFRSGNYKFHSKVETLKFKNSAPRLSSLEKPKYDKRFNIVLSKGKALKFTIFRN